MDDLIEELQTLAATLRRPDNFDAQARDILQLHIIGLESVLSDLRKAVEDEYYAERDK